MFDNCLHDMAAPPETLTRRRALVAGDPAAAALAQQLEEIGQRLGTLHERPDDPERAQHLGHELRNLLCVLALPEPARWELRAARPSRASSGRWN